MFTVNSCVPVSECGEVNKRAICTNGGVQICFNTTQSSTVFTEEDPHDLLEYQT